MVAGKAATHEQPAVNSASQSRARRKRLAYVVGHGTLRLLHHDLPHRPIAGALGRVDEWWSILILRDALHGYTRFDQFQDSLGIAPNMLSRRLKTLVEAGMLETRQYCQRPPLNEYILTDCGREFRAVLVALYSWGSKHFSSEGASVLLVDTATGRVADSVLVDRATGRSMLDPGFAFAPGPTATDSLRRRLAESPWGVATDTAQTPQATAPPRIAEDPMTAPAGTPSGTAAAISPRTRMLLEGCIDTTPLTLAWPNVLVMLAQASTGLIETWFVSRRGTDALAGMALVSPGLMMT